jgi:RimJ/RimL family protein N-acetyltransferase
MRATDIRNATKDDAEAITSVIRGLGTPNSGLSGDWDQDRVREWISRLGGDGLIVVAYDGSIPAAFGALDYSTTEPEIGLLGVWVLPEHRRKGLATDIADRLIDFARERGYRKIRGRLPEGNEPALSFLSAIGAMVPLRNPSMSFELPL